MAKSSFLDKGLLLGYCFLVDVHHDVCKDYILSEDIDSYVTEYVLEAFTGNKSRLVREHRRDLLQHVSELENSQYDGRLGPMDLKQIRNNMINRKEYPKAWRYLRDYYNIHDIISVGEIKEEMREIAREIESRAEERFSKFQEEINDWERIEAYPSAQSALEEIKEDKVEDFWICIDAHDLAERVSGHTELATTDLNDLIRDGRRDLIVDNTQLDDVVAVAVTR